MKNLVICGDSFSIGIGCEDLINEPYGSLLAKDLNLNLINLAKGSSTNLSISLQVKYAIENIKDIELLIIGTTCYHRTEWFPENSKRKGYVDNLNVNYHEYPPYGKGTYENIINHPMKNDNRYTGEMLTENWLGIIHYNEMLDKNSGNLDFHFKKFSTESVKRMRLLRDYFYEFYNSSIQRQYDIGTITMSHNLLKNNNIKHYILSDDLELNMYVDDKNVIHNSWGKLSKKYPDLMKSLHTSHEGHKIVFNTIKDVLNRQLKFI